MSPEIGLVPKIETGDPRFTASDGIRVDPDWGYSINYGYYGSWDRGIPVLDGEGRGFFAAFVAFVAFGLAGFADRFVADDFFAARLVADCFFAARAFGGSCAIAPSHAIDSAAAAMSAYTSASATFVAPALPHAPAATANAGLA